MTGAPEGDASIMAVRQQAFRLLLDGRAPTPAELAASAELETGQVERAIEELRDQGALEVNPSEQVVGAHGLTQRTTQHAAITSEHTWHTWCALDAVGIPVALGLDATAVTTCPTCSARLAVPIRAGHARPLPFVLWLPMGPCTHLTRDFCSAANLFCHAAHLEHWRRHAGNPHGQAISLAEVENIGRRSWADVADAGRTVLAIDTATNDSEA